MTTLYLAAAAVLAAAPAFGSTIDVMVGDNDCFGTGASPCLTVAPPATFGGTDDRSGPGDPPGTNVFGPLGTISFDFNLNLGSEIATAATLFTQAVGLDLVDLGDFGDTILGARFTLMNSNLSAPVDIGLYTPSTDPFTPTPPGQVVQIMFSFDPALLVANGTNTISIIPEEAFEQFAIFEDYAIDYLNLSVTTAPPPTAMPLPATGLLLVSGLGAVGLQRRRRQNQRRNSR